jgi:UDP-glucose 4-epimerase
MRLAVTGATGFLGSHFTEHALSRGHQVVAACRSKHSTNALFASSNLEWVFGDLPDFTNSQLGHPEVLVHFASAGVSPQVATPDEMFRCNVQDSYRLWDNLVEGGIRKLVICGSAFEYGKTADRYERIPPNAPLEPTTTYGASKAAASLAAISLHYTRGASVSILRPFNVYGDRQHPKNLWPSLRHAAQSGLDFPMSDGKQIRDFVEVEKVASEFLNECQEINSRTPTLAIRNVGSGIAISVADFCKAWWKQWNATGQLRIGSLPSRANEISRYVPEL